MKCQRDRRDDGRGDGGKTSEGSHAFPGCHPKSTVQFSPPVRDEGHLEFLPLVLAIATAHQRPVGVTTAQGSVSVNCAAPGGRTEEEVERRDQGEPYQDRRLYTADPPGDDQDDECQDPQ